MYMRPGPVLSKWRRSPPPIPTQIATAPQRSSAETGFCGKLSSDAITWADVCAPRPMKYWTRRSKCRALLQSRGVWTQHLFAMPSDRKIAANQQNSQHSTGPRTALAKKRIRRNALRHGLAATVVNGPGIPAETNRLAQAICGSDTGPAQREQAQIIAECEL